MVVNYFPLNASQTLLVHTMAIPPSWSSGSDKSVTITVPIGFIIAGSNLTAAATFSIGGMGASNAVVNKNGVLFSSPVITPSNSSAATTKTFTSASVGAYSIYSYFNSYTFSFTPNVAVSTNDTYTCYLYFNNANGISGAPSANGAAITSSNLSNTTPTNWGFVVNPSNALSAFTNAAYSSSTDTTVGYITYGYTINNSVTTKNINTNTVTVNYTIPPLYTSNQIGYSNVVNSSYNSLVALTVYNTSIIIPNGVWLIVISNQLTGTAAFTNIYQETCGLSITALATGLIAGASVNNIQPMAVSNGFTTYSNLHTFVQLVTTISSPYSISYNWLSIFNWSGGTTVTGNFSLRYTRIA